MKLTLALLNYYWLKMELDVKQYVLTCFIYQQDKAEHSKPFELLKPLFIYQGDHRRVSH